MYTMSPIAQCKQGESTIHGVLCTTHSALQHVGSTNGNIMQTAVSHGTIHFETNLLFSKAALLAACITLRV